MICITIFNILPHQINPSSLVVMDGTDKCKLQGYSSTLSSFYKTSYISIISAKLASIRLQITSSFSSLLKHTSN